MTQKRPPLGHRLRAVLNEPLRRFQLSLLILVLLVAAGSAGYMLLEGASWLDALYMTVITLATVGYRESVVLHPAGQLFTIGLIVLGVGVGAWAATNAIEVMLGQTFWVSVQRRRMERTLEQIGDHYIVCGYGRLGQRIVRDLEAQGEQLVIIEQAHEPEEQLLERGIPHIIGDATLDDVILRAGVERARGLVAALDSDANNVLTVLTARELNPRLLIVARANTETSESKLRRAGANRVVTPEAIGGHRLTLALLRPVVHDFFSRIFSYGVGEMDVDVGQLVIPADSPFAGQTVAGCDLRRMRNVSILAVQLSDGEFVLNPQAQRTIEPGETLILIGPAEAIYELEAMYSSSGV